ncbi:MAG: glycosyltransferase family 1 protein, partial [Planctomycetota bacterium]|nr:glycosyltransferase family 1 protein [Planctomycetota bacterium]
MRVALDASAALGDRPTGVSRAVCGLITGFSETADTNEFILCVRLSRWRPWRSLSRVGRERRFRKTLIGRHLPRSLSRSIDLFHGPDVRLPPHAEIPLVSTFHDLSALHDGGFAPERFRERRQSQWEEAVEKASAIVVYSNAIRREVREKFSLAADRVMTIPLGVSSAFRRLPSTQVERVRRRYGLPAKYLLSVGGLSRRKGSVHLMEAFRRVDDPDLALVICGRDGYGSEEAVGALERLGLATRVRRIGHVSADADLVALYSGASACILPSLYEGFGLSVLEAMACQTPVVATRCPAVAEVAGDAARLVPVAEPERLSDAISEVLGDEVLRETLVARGIER